MIKSNFIVSKIFLIFFLILEIIEIHRHLDHVKPATYTQYMVQNLKNFSTSDIAIKVNTFVSFEVNRSQFLQRLEEVCADSFYLIASEVDEIDSRRKFEQATVEASQLVVVQSQRIEHSEWLQVFARYALQVRPSNVQQFNAGVVIRQSGWDTWAVLIYNLDADDIFVRITSQMLLCDAGHCKVGRCKVHVLGFAQIKLRIAQG